MRTIKKFSLVMMTAVMAVFMTACGGGAADPGDTAKNFLNALQELDFETAKKYATSGSAEVLDMMKSMTSAAPEGEMPEPKAVEVTNVEEDGETAKVTYTLEGEEETQTVDLKMEEGEWKVVFDKSAMQGGMGDDIDIDMDEDEDMEEDHDMEDHDHEMEEGDTTMMEGDM